MTRVTRPDNPTGSIEMATDPAPQITEVRLHPPKPKARARRVLRHVTIVVDACLRLDGIVVLEGCDGRPLVRYPSRRGRGGRRHPFIEPITKAFRERLSDEVLRAMSRELEEHANINLEHQQ